MARRILLVEDDQLTRELVSGILTAKGYSVETATDGVSAVERICRGGFDLALMDYHLPEVDGYASAKLVGAMAPTAERPKMVALTADARSLTAREGSGSVFDAVLAKPFDPTALCATIDRLLSDPLQDELVRSSAEMWRACGLEGRPRVFAAPKPTREQAAAIGRYFDLVDDPRAADLMALTDADGLDDLSSARRHGVAHLSPTLDLTGVRGRELDRQFRPEDPETWSAIASAIRGFGERAAQLTPAMRYSTDPAARLMAQLYVSARALEPVPDPGDRRFFAYTGASGREGLTALADGLADQGLLTRSFAERFHACTDCGSHRLNVREECGFCRSPELREVKLLKHFRCSAVAPEDDFRRDGWFTCPKCAHSLGRYAEDYVRIGEALRCNACAAANDEASIGFVCLDCGSHADGAEVETRDVHAYALTARATRLLIAPDALLAPPAPYTVNDLATRLSEAGRRTVVAELRFTTAERVIATEGWAAFETLRRLFREQLQAVLGENVRIISEKNADFLVLLDVTAEDFAASQEAVVQRCETAMERPLGARIAILHAA